MSRKHKFSITKLGNTGQSAEFDGDSTFLTEFKAWLFDLISRDIIDTEVAKWCMKFIDFFQVCDEADLTMLNRVRITYSNFEVTE